MKKIYVILILLTILISSYFIYANSQKQYIEVVITGTQTPPFEFYDENYNLVGIDIEFLEKIFDKLNINYKTVFMDWDDAIGYMEKGKGDIILGAGYSKEREEIFSFTEEQKTENIPSDALWIEAEKIFYREGESYNLNSLKEIEENNYRIGIVKGYLYFDDFWNYDLNIYSYGTAESLILGLDKGEVDLIMLDVIEESTLEQSLNLKNKISSHEEAFNIGSNLILFSKKYDQDEYKKIKDNFYKELIRLKTEENLHEELYKKYTGKNFTETYGEFI